MFRGCSFVGKSMSLVLGTEVSMSHMTSLGRPLVSCLSFKCESPVSALIAPSADHCHIPLPQWTLILLKLEAE